jgi:hypothetical protein
MNNNQEGLSICIPRVSSTIDRKYIKTVFEKIIGLTSNIQIVFVDIKNDERFKRVFVNIKYGSSINNNKNKTNDTNDKINNLCQRLENGKQLKIVYSDPLFWRCSLSTTKPNYINK